MTKNAQQGTTGFGSPPGRMNAEMFTEWMNYFIKHTNPTPELLVLLVKDNYDSHISLSTIKL